MAIKSELSGWLTIGIFTFGFIVLIQTIRMMFALFGSYLSLWFHPTLEVISLTEEKAWFLLAIFCLNNLPQLTIALFLTLAPQSLARLSLP